MPWSVSHGVLAFFICGLFSCLYLYDFHGNRIELHKLKKHENYTGSRSYYVIIIGSVICTICSLIAMHFLILQVGLYKPILFYINLGFSHNFRVRADWYQ